MLSLMMVFPVHSGEMVVVNTPLEIQDQLELLQLMLPLVPETMMAATVLISQEI